MSTGDVRHYSLSGKDYWQTPQWLVELLENHIKIGLDPCAGAETEIGSCANFRLGDGDDGLEASWDVHPHPCIKLNAFINPPFELELKKKWVHKTIEEYRAGNVQRAILLTPASPTVKSWFQGERGERHGIIEEADAIWFPNGRINFYDPDGGEVKKNNATGTMLSFFGEVPDGLIEVLEEPSEEYEQHDGGVVWGVDR